MDIKVIAEKIHKNGGRLYLVGGAVRNLLLGITPKDYDYCVTGLTADEFLEIFPNAFLRGKDFPVFDLNNTEFALARKEHKSTIGHTGFKIDTNKSITIEDDLKRRDLTINSIAMDVLTEKIIDPFNGKKDIDNKLIKATSNAFNEDPLRVYRAARFSAEYDFEIDSDTLVLMTSLRDELHTLSAERVFAEFRKALCSKKPSQFFIALKNCNCLDIHFKEIYNLIGIEQPLKYHPEGDVFNHTMEVIERAAQQSDDELIRFAALVHDFGKIATPKNILPHHYNHENNGDAFVVEFCKHLKLPNDYKKVGLTSCKEHMLAGKYNELKYSTKVDFLSRISKTLLGIKGLEIIANSDKKREIKIEFASIGEKMIKEINGKTVDIKNLDYHKAKDKIRQARIDWLKQNS